MAKYNAEQLRQMLAKGQAMRNPAGDPSYPIGDAEDLQNAIHAVGRGAANGDAIRRYIMGRAKALGKTSMIPDTWNADGSLRADDGGWLEPDLPYARTVAVDDVRVRTEGDGTRTVEAYAAIFEKGYDVRDPDGEYTEVLDRGVFNRALEHARQSGRKTPVLFNHGLTIHGTPDPEASIPIGVAEEVVADQRGLFTRARFHPTPRADAVLAAIEGGSIAGYSFSGVFKKSDPSRRSGARYRGGQTVRRLESTLREFGPAVYPANPAAEIIGVRTEQLYQMLLTQQFGTPTSVGLASPDGDPADSHSPRTPHEQVRAAYARFTSRRSM